MTPPTGTDVREQNTVVAVQGPVVRWVAKSQVPESV